MGGLIKAVEIIFFEAYESHRNEHEHWNYERVLKSTLNRHPAADVKGGGMVICYFFPC